MKKFSILALVAMLALSFAACSSSSEVKKDDAKKTVEPVVDPKVVCKADADKKFDACVTAAGKVKKKADACAKDKTKAYADCEKVKVAEPVKKEEVKKAVKK